MRYVQVCDCHGFCSQTSTVTDFMDLVPVQEKKAWLFHRLRRLSGKLRMYRGRCQRSLAVAIIFVVVATATIVLVLSFGARQETTWGPRPDFAIKEVAASLTVMWEQRGL